MRLKQLLFVIIFFISFSTYAFAKKTAIVAANNIDAIESTYRSLQDLSANFVQTTKVELVDRTVIKKGTFRFKKGGKIRIEYEGKDGKNYISDGSTLWTYIEGDKKSLQTFAIDDETVPKEALSFLNGFGTLKKEFSVTASSAFPDAPAGTDALHLVPRGKAKHFESLDALFGPDHLLSQLVIKNTSGNTSNYKFSEIKTNTNLSDGLFTPTY